MDGWCPPLAAIELDSATRALARPRVLLMLAIALAIGLFAIAQGDAPRGDPLAYAEHAHAIATDAAAYFREPTNHPFAMRIGVTLPLAVIYRALGVSTWTTNLPCLIAAIVTLLVVYAAAPSDRAKRAGLAFTASSTALVLHGGQLNADLLCGAATAVSLLLLSRRDRSGSAWWVAGAVAVWFCAFLIKETTIWFAPAWIYAIAVDVHAIGWRRGARRFAPALGLGLALGVMYLAACAHVWGDPVARITGINAIAGDHHWTSRGRSIGWWWFRLTVGPPLVFITTFGVALAVAVVASPRTTGASRLWVVATASYLVMFWFGSASSDEYVPLPLTHGRMLTEALPGVLVVAALAGETLRWRRGWVVLVAVAAALPIAGVTAYVGLRERPETALHAALRDDLAAAGRDVVIVCPDFHCLQATPFYFGFRVPASARIVSVAELTASPPPAGAAVRVVVTPRRVADDASIMDTIEALELRPVFWHHRVRLYDAGDGGQLHTALRRRNQ